MTLLLGASVLSGCSGAGLWPFGAGAQRSGTAGAGTPAAAPGTAAVVVADESELLPAVRLVAAERGRTGVILRVEAVAATQGFHSPELRPVARGADGIEVVEVRARPPVAPQPVGAEATRVLSIGRFYSNREMRDIRGFRVVAALNAGTATAP